MAKSPEEAKQSMVNNLLEKTGKDLPAWLQVVTTTNVEKHGEIVKFLKSEHSVTHGFANLIAHEFLSAATGETDLMDAQYAGDKAKLLPVYQLIVQTAESFGKDVIVSPKKANVSLRRSTQFALIQPSTKTRVDLGIKLRDFPPEGRLEASGSFNSMVTHRVRLSQVSDIDQEVIDWLKQAYDQA
ncbi:MAG: DUF4287 domain-containing protein [Pseudomonadales bacterium]|nr:DUF4287 domain-containing protein [Pseudomonadales bacterium]